MIARPCLDCGTPSASTRCPACRGYDGRWTKLSRKARKLQRFCTDCHSTRNLQLDHLPSAWQRRAQGLPIRLGIDTEVVCGPCNTRRGQARPSNDGAAQQHSRRKGGEAPPVKAQVRPASLTPSYTPRGVSDARGA